MLKASDLEKLKVIRELKSSVIDDMKNMRTKVDEFNQNKKTVCY